MRLNGVIVRHWITLLITSFFLLLLLLTLSACRSHEKKVGVIVPIEHRAMDDIVQGFESTLKKDYKNAIYIKVSNAQGDINLQQAIIKQMKEGKYDVIVPIGTQVTQMTMAALPKQPIVSLAAKYSDKERKQQKQCMALVQDEIPTAKIIDFIHHVYPHFNNIALIHSTADKIYPEIDAAVSKGKQLGITIKPLLVTSLNELYTIAHSIPTNTQAILILKDHLIVSGIATLEKLTTQKQWPLIASDQGSIQGGATFALGVEEKAIGEVGAHLTAAFLLKQSRCYPPIVSVNPLTVFINKKALQRIQQNDLPIQQAAKNFNYAIEFVTEQ